MPAYVLYALLLVGLGFLVVRQQRLRLRRAVREGRLAVVEQDLALTGAVQSGFLPQQNEITTEYLQVIGFYRPADACSGDWWWHEQFSDGRHVVLVGDVTGHGPGPAMVTAAVATAFRVLVGAGLDDITAALELLNREVLRVAKGKYHMTMLAFELDQVTGNWTIHSAGGPPMMSLDSNGNSKIHFCPGAPLGTAQGFELGRMEGRLRPFDRILLYTDGIPEIDGLNGQTLGMRRLGQIYQASRQRPLHEAANEIVLAADTTQAGAPQLDDWTFTMLEWNGEPSTITTAFSNQ